MWMFTNRHKGKRLGYFCISAVHERLFAPVRALVYVNIIIMLHYRHVSPEWDIFYLLVQLIHLYLDLHFSRFLALTPDTPNGEIWKMRQVSTQPTKPFSIRSEEYAHVKWRRKGQLGSLPLKYRQICSHMGIQRNFYGREKTWESWSEYL